MICTAVNTGSDSDLALRYCDVRRKSLLLCEPLQIDDYGVQSMPDASPVKWHLAHTTWFFEQFVLVPELRGYLPLDLRYLDLFNSYYQGLGTHSPRARRSALTRPTLAEVIRYRHYVDERVLRLLVVRSDDESVCRLVTLGINHEQQHQELILTDIKHAFALNPLSPVYREPSRRPAFEAAPVKLEFVAFDGGIHWAGADVGFTFDNEGPRHRVLIEPFAIANRLVTNEEYLAFVRTGGYRRADLWLADGWTTVNSEQWSKPLYWHESLESEFTLHGVDALVPTAPVCHLSYYEADAFARWAGMRLPTEFEWEAVTKDTRLEGNFADGNILHPLPALSRTARSDSDALPRSPPYQMFGDTWEWTASTHSPYPGYVPLAGPLGDYNGKFMCNQMVLRGGSCATAADHIRASYRNFFYPHARWQFSGIRLAR